VRVFCRVGGASDAVWWGGVADMLADIAAALVQGTSIRGDRVQTGQGGRIWWETDEESSRAATEERARNQAIRESAEQHLHEG
jgi:hypothetical protein